MQQSIRTNDAVHATIRKTLQTGQLFDGFWDRWIAHGLESSAVKTFKPHLKTLSCWIDGVKELAESIKEQGRLLQGQALAAEAEILYRTAGLHYQLIQWIFPETCDEKRMWFIRSKEMTAQADETAAHTIEAPLISMDGSTCFGRVRIPENPRGCVILVNPIDSSKEELFTYEMDFADRGFATVSFDGPGQGETYTMNGFRASRQRWEQFLNQVIDFAANRFPELELHLFGTSSGASWAIKGSAHPNVSKTAAVSPACENGLTLPDYFLERLSYILDDGEASPLPLLNHMDRCGPVYLFHGKKDVMVRDEDIVQLFERLPANRRLTEYNGEGHCCNFKLDDVRLRSAQWFMEA